VTSKVLIVEDERAVRQMLSFVLSKAGFETFEAPDAMSAMDEAARCKPDIAILDWRLPDMEGVKLLKVWRADETTARLPVIMLSARADESDRVAGLKAGADDYIVKPFGRDELVARVHALLRRAGATDLPARETREFAGLRMDLRGLRVTAHDRPVSLGPMEFKLLNVFMGNVGRVLTRSQIVDRVWPPNAYVDARTVDVHIRRLRSTLQASGHHVFVQTVRGVGYRFASAVIRDDGDPQPTGDNTDKGASDTRPAGSSMRGTTISVAVALGAAAGMAAAPAAIELTQSNIT
jgi:two-component system phosphate regulon response regulator PhoB